MSLAATLARAAASAQSTLAQLGGMASGGTNLLLPGGAAVVAVYGPPQTIFVPAPGGGYRKKHTLVATVTRDQLAAAPADQSQLVRTDFAPPVTYIVDFVNRDRALDWEIHLARMGEK